MLRTSIKYLPILAFVIAVLSLYAIQTAPPEAAAATGPRIKVEFFEEGDWITVSGLGDRVILESTQYTDRTFNAVRITNVGDAPLEYDNSITVTPIWPQGHTAISLLTTKEFIPFLQPGQSKTVSLIFGPADAPDRYRSRVLIDHNDPFARNPFEFRPEGRLTE